MFVKMNYNYLVLLISLIAAGPVPVSVNGIFKAIGRSVIPSAVEEIVPRSAVLGSDIKVANLLVLAKDSMPRGKAVNLPATVDPVTVAKLVKLPSAPLSNGQMAGIGAGIIGGGFVAGAAATLIAA